MSSDSSLTCNFTIVTSLNVGISFESDDGGANYGGQITIWTPGTAGPVTTGLWDSDGNVCFTIYDLDNAANSCVINSGSVPGSWTPSVELGRASGLACAIAGPTRTGEATYAYTLTVSAGAEGAPGENAVAADPPPPAHVADLVLPAGGMAAWTQIMQGGGAVPDQINPGSPIVMAWTRFDDGTQVAGGVYKSATPADYNVKFMWVLDGNGNQYPGWPIDVSDDQDFLTESYAFSLTGGAVADYLLNIVENQQGKAS